MKDAPTIGGYARFANIISADLDKVSQLKPGDEVSFSLFKKNKNKLLIPIIG
jgi:allophanate hydrolase subunit 2